MYLELIKALDFCRLACDLFFCFLVSQVLLIVYLKCYW